ncbi:MAG TPA: AMP-binding protein [Thermaerobacter sp.]
MGTEWFTLGDLVRKQAVSHPNRSVLIWPGGHMSYAQLDERTSRIANALSERGIRPGDRVALLTENSTAAVEWIFALAKLGAMAVPINLRLNPQEIAYILEDAGVAALFAGRMVFPVLQSLPPDWFEGILKVAATDDGTPLPPGWERHDALLQAHPDRPSKSGPGPEDPAVLLYTSGTTGRPKGCMLPHRAWLANGINIMAAFGVYRQDTYLATLPLFHVAGLGMLIAHVQAGATILPLPKWDPEQAVRLAHETGV